MKATMTAPLTEREVKELATLWYQKLDVHAPLAELLALVADNDLEMKFPEATLHGPAEFAKWYEGVIRIFFDEVHKLKKVDVQLTPEGAKVDVVVHWEASVWKSPAAKSERIKLDAYQTWFVKRSESTDRAVVARYTVDRLAYDKDSAKL
jgi:hypothetical protein